MPDDVMSRPLRRRPLLLALAGGGAALTGVGVAARSGVLSGEPSTPHGDALQLAGSGDDAVASLELGLTRELLTPQRAREWTTVRLTTETFTMVGVTWRPTAVPPVVEVSTRADGAWRPWQPMPRAHSASAGAGADGTEVAWTGPSDGVRVRVRGTRPAGLTLVLLRPERLANDSAADAELAATSVTATGVAAARRVPPPSMFGRRHWGANERWRDGTADYNRMIKQVHVHHTANSNDYRRRDVPALIRGMYRYHTKNLGWSDIGYNFLVDRFGRIWVGRAGGPRRGVRGAHTLGFNHASTGVAVIGNYETARPTKRVIGALARIAAWKLAPYGQDPMGRTRIRSAGSDKYRDGRPVVLPVIDGHRDTNDTACPGRHLYAALPRVRRRARRRIRRFRKRR